MTLTLYYHPLSSYSWKALIALYETGADFQRVIVDAETRPAFLEVWPIGKFPVLLDAERSETVPESSVAIEYLDRHRPGAGWLIPADPELAWRARLWDRFFDLHIHEHMQKIVGDRLRPSEAKDSFGVAEARGRLAIAYGVAEAQAAGRTWICGDDFSLADCAAAPALYYADKVQPLSAGALRAYLDRLMDRPSFARVLEEAEPYFNLFPRE
ncbi:MAG TPA: glutathione S-transferase family protein [Caulobacteraceae bacterium]|nr:glutathione S-transferase family protein [Caulobacteraceae bacterium]